MKLKVKMSRRVVKVTFVGDDEVHEFIKSAAKTKGSSKSGQSRDKAVDVPSSDDESSLSEQENELADIKPTAVYSDEDEGIYGQDVFTFSNATRKTGSMARKAGEAVDSRPTKSATKSARTGKETPKPILKKQSKFSDENNNGTPKQKSKKVVTNTPYRLRARNEDAEESSDDSATSSDDEQDGGDQDVGEEDDSAKMDVAKEAVVAKKSSALTMKDLVEDYFHSAGDKPVTSDRTLAKLNTPRMDAKSLIEIVGSLPSMYKRERIQLYKQYAASFSKWMFQLCNGRNILLHGLGSKRPLLEMFRTKMLSDNTHLVVNGFFPSLTLKHVLSSIVEDLLDYEDASQAVNDLQDKIINHYKKEPGEDLFLIINNIDGVMLRSEKVQNALSHLAEVRNIHLIASVDHINAPLIWDQAKCSRFQWIWYDCTTYEPYSEETSYENSLLVQQSGVLALSSLRHVMRSLTPNAKQIFHLLTNHQMDQSGNSSYIGLSFPDLYQKCREAFLVNSNLTLKAQLTEFRDHKLIKSKKGTDGTEHLYIPLDEATLKEFMENKDEH